MGDEGEIGGIQRRQHALIFALLHLRVGHIADQGEIEGALLRVDAPPAANSTNAAAMARIEFGVMDVPPTLARLFMLQC